MSEFDPTVLLTKDDGDYENEDGFEFDLDDEELMGELFAAFEAEDYEEEESEMIQAEHIDLEAAIKFDVPGEKQSSFGLIREREFTIVNAPPGRKEYKDINLYDYDPDCVPIIYVKNDVLILRSNSYKSGKGYVVGKVLQECYISNLPLNTNDVIKRASIYNEEVKGRGSGLGYSSFLHLLVCLMMGKTNAVIEPIGGCDVLVDGILIEITGNNYEHRETKAMWVINKYLIFSLLFPKTGLYEQILRASQKEDHFETDFFLGTSIDNGPSPYTNLLSQLHNQTRQLTDVQITAFKSFHLQWYKEKIERREYKKTMIEANDSSIISEIFMNEKLFKTIDEKFLCPCPYKVLMFSDHDITPIELKKRREDIIKLKDYVGGTSSFRTLELSDDPFIYSKLEAQNIIRHFDRDFTSYEEMVRRSLSKYAIFQAAEIESELLSKIVGKRGCFYSEVSQLGISWDMLTTKLSYYACFYSYEKPNYSEKIVGRYYYDGKVYRSGTFRVSLSYLRFATSLPSRMTNVVLAVQPMLKMRSFNDTIPKLLEIFMTWRWSSWETTRLAGNSRYITTCHINQSGNIQNLVDSQLSPHSRLSHSDYFYLRAIERYVKEPKDYNKTPIFRLPLSLLSLEKDLPLGMNWHIRQTKHATRCMTKVLLAVRYDQERREERIKFIKHQVDFLNKTMEIGTNFQDYKNFMSLSPDFPHFNLIYFLALVKINEEDLIPTGLTQESTDFNLQNIVSGSNNLSLVNGVAGNSKVFKELRELPPASGAHELLLKLSSQEEKIPNIFSVHPKDQKSGDRDIEQMHIKIRPFQLARESLISVASKTVEMDHMKDKTKHLSFVEGFGKILRSKNAKALTSEDRSFHSGYNYPEEMSLAYLAVARISGSTSIVTSSAIQRMNTKRTLIFPFDYDPEDEIAKEDTNGIEGLGSIMKSQSKSLKRVKTVETYAHFLQGIDVIGASVINTMKTAADLKTASLLYDGIEDVYAAVTSDDVGKGITIKKGYNSNFLINLALVEPLKDCNKVMMLNNEKKFSCVENSIEINNTCITQTGMVSQGPIFAVLVNQPLKSSSIVIDMMQVVSDARSTIFWGNSPTLSFSAYYGGKDELRQKWFLSEDDIDLLEQVGFLPSSIEELISGFFPRNKKIFKMLYEMHDEEDREKIQYGLISLMGPASIKYAKKSNKQMQKIKDCNHLSRLANKMALRMRIESHNTTSINQRWATPMTIKDRLAIKNAFMKDISSAVANSIDPVEHDKIYDLLRPGDITINFRRLRRSDTFPTNMGSTTTLIMPEVKRIRAKRFLGVDYLARYEHEMITAPEEIFEEFENRIQVINNKLGVGFKSAGGLPLVKFCGSRIFKQPYVFNFLCEYKPVGVLPNDRIGQITYENNVITDFRPSLWSTTTLLKAKRDGSKYISIGTGNISGQPYVFYQPRGGKIRIKHRPNNKGYFRIDDLAVLCGIDTSPLDPRKFDVENFDCNFPGLSGDIIAIYNYLGYSRSNLNRPYKVLQKIFHKFNSTLPQEYQRLFPDFPYNILGSEQTIISGYGMYNLIGNKSIYKLKLEYVSQSRKIADVDLLNEIPTLPLNLIEEEELNLLDY